VVEGVPAPETTVGLTKLGSVASVGGAYPTFSLLVASRIEARFGAEWESRNQDPNPVGFGLPPGDSATPAFGCAVRGDSRWEHRTRPTVSARRFGSARAPAFEGDGTGLLTNTYAGGTAWEA